MAEPGDGTRNVAQHNQLGRAGRGLFSTTSIGTPPVDIDLRSVLRRSIDPRGRDAGGGQPGRRVRANGATTRRIWRQLLAGGAQEFRHSRKAVGCRTLDVLTAECSAVRRLVSASTILRQLRDLLRGKRLGDLLLAGCGLVAVRGEQPRQQLALQLIQRHRLERLYDEKMGRGWSCICVTPHDPRDHPTKALVHVGQVAVLGEQIQQHLPHRVDIVGRQRIGPSSSASEPPRVRPTPRETTGRTWRRRCRGGRTGAAPRTRCPRAAPHDPPAQGGHHRPAVHRLPTVHEIRFAKGFHEPDQVTG